MAEEREKKMEEEFPVACWYHYSNNKQNMRELYGEGYGDCRICICDPKNKQCRGYIPRHLYFEVPSRIK